VGYGDILPTNGYEFIWAMTIIVFGVAIVSYILSDLSSKFKELYKNKKNSEDRLKNLQNLEIKYSIGFELMDKINEFSTSDMGNTEF
jgi:hypothetical protein